MQTLETAGLAMERECCRCPRLVAFRHENRTRFPKWHNAPVPSFGCQDAWLLIVGLAPGLYGANRTGRPFTGDFAGTILYATLTNLGFAYGIYKESSSDGLFLKGCRITNAVRCVPPANKPLTEETRLCISFLEEEIAGLQQLKVILALGKIAHESVSIALGLKKSSLPFIHGTWHKFDNGLLLADSYHCSRYNVQTGRLTEVMFRNVFRHVLAVTAGG